MPTQAGLDSGRTVTLIGAGGVWGSRIQGARLYPPSLIEPTCLRSSADQALGTRQDTPCSRDSCWAGEVTRWPLVSWKQREDPVSGHSALSGDGQGAAAASSPGRGGRGAALRGETAAGQSSLSRVAHPRLGTWAPTWLPSSEARIALTPQGGTPLSRWVLPPAVLLHLCPGRGLPQPASVWALPLLGPGPVPVSFFILFVLLGRSLPVQGQQPLCHLAQPSHGHSSQTVSPDLGGHFHLLAVTAGWVSGAASLQGRSLRFLPEPSRLLGGSETEAGHVPWPRLPVLLACSVGWPGLGASGE